MSKLQNNFTTPEQSKRLLELGIPADNADVPMIVFKDGTYIYKEVLKDKTLSEYQREDDAFQNEQDYPSYVHYWPSWSVGRLIEIYLTCALEYHPYDDFYTETPSLHLMAFDKDRLIEEVIEIMSEDEMDFSKLEE